MSKPNKWTVLGMLEWGTQYFEERGVPSPRLSIEWLLADILKVKRLDLYVQFDRPLSQDALSPLREMVKRRASHEPLQYITGYTTFYNAEIAVNPSVLIPRPETEELVEMVLTENPQNNLQIVDIGTGSGCIPIAISKARPTWNVTGIDISDEALKTAAQNNILNQTNVILLKGDLSNPKTLPGEKWDIIVSNPPYIHNSEKAEMDRQVKDYEPKLALFCENRSQVYKHLITYAESSLKIQGKLYLEIHEEHYLENEDLFNDLRWNFTIIRDMGHKRRFVAAVLKN